MPQELLLNVAKRERRTGETRRKKARRQKEIMIELNFRNWLLKEGTFDLEKDRGLRGWFDRNGGKGWVDCKASKKGKIVPCGRKKAGRGADREYPACRPTLSACNSVGKKRKKGSKPVSWKKD